MQISRTGMDVEWQRLQVIAQNLANMNTVGGGYRPARLVSAPATDFARVLAARGASPAGVRALGLAAIAGGERRVHDPDNPLADADGFVTSPAVDHAGEMALLLQTARAYEADLTAMSVAHQMYAHALELGRAS